MRRKKLKLLFSICKNPPEMFVWNRFWVKVDIRKWRECWDWKAYANTEGYGRFGPNRAHRLICSWLYGDIPRHLTVDHIWCNRPGCVNPLHLVPATIKQNVIRPGSKSMSYIYARRTSCNNGHPFTEDNTRIDRRKRSNKVSRTCRTCDSARSTKRYEEKKLMLAGRR